MPYTDQLRSHCRGCDRPREPNERFSARGKCAECGEGRMISNYRALVAHDGPEFEHWRRQCLAAFGIRVVDEPAGGE